MWQVLTDFAAYPDWNPFLTRVVGPLETGARLEMQLVQPGGAQGNFRPTVLVVAPPNELRWLSPLLPGGLFNGEHRFAIEPSAPGHVRFLQEERFSGLFSPLLHGLVTQLGRSKFDAMNWALKARVESGSPSP